MFFVFLANAALPPNDAMLRHAINTQNTKVGRAAAHARRVAALEKKLGTAEETRAGEAAEIARVEADIASVRDALTKAERYNARALAEIAKLDAQVEALPPEQREQLRRLFDVYTRAESLREQEATFKASCKGQLAELQATLASLRGAASTGDTAQRVAQLQKMHTDAKARYDRARAIMAERSRELARITRLIDDYPGRAELIQYERRFLELFDEVCFFLCA